VEDQMDPSLWWQIQLISNLTYLADDGKGPLKMGRKLEGGVRSHIGLPIRLQVKVYLLTQFNFLSLRFKSAYFSMRCWACCIFCWRMARICS
jgi:hypothetical protein